MFAKTPSYKVNRPYETNHKTPLYMRGVLLREVNVRRSIWKIHRWVVLSYADTFHETTAYIYKCLRQSNCAKRNTGVRVSGNIPVDLKK